MGIRSDILLAALAVLVLAATPSPCQTQTVVLDGGATIEVAGATVSGGYLLVTFPDGHTQAFLLEDVDLEASGLTARPADRAAPTGPTSIADARSSVPASARITLTDADVDHVRAARRSEPGEEEPEQAGDEPRPAALLVSDLAQQMSGGMMTLTGRVRNSGGQPVTAVTLQAQAVDDQGAVAGSGATSIPDEIAPGGAVSFTIEFPVRGRVTDVKVSARAAIAAFDFEPVAEPESGGTAE